MFRRDKSSTAPPTAPGEAVDQESTAKVGGKGRPTPKRSQAQARNRTPLVGPLPARKDMPRDERRAAKLARREAMREQRLRAAEGVARGDERYMMLRDRGPAKRMVRDLVDARRNVGEFFLPVAVVSFAFTIVNLPIARLIGAALLYGMVLSIILDSFVLHRKITRAITAKHGAAEAKGVGMYAVLRALQFRRGRRPPPMVARGAAVE